LKVLFPWLLPYPCELSAYPLSDTEDVTGLSWKEGPYIHPRSFLPSFPNVTAPPDVIRRIRNGMQVQLPEFSCAPLVKCFADQHTLAAIVRRVAGPTFRPIVVL
jgi:tRNA pseudouridine55 synthase